MENSRIEWTDHTFNPWIGCTKVSEGCRHCYAYGIGARLQVKWGPGQPRREASESAWREVHGWNRRAARTGQPARVFCASLADVCDAEAPAGARDRLWETIRETPWLMWLLLTKRPHLWPVALPSDWGQGYPNVALGTTVEDHQAVYGRIPALTGTPARYRFLSCEPLIGPIDLKPWLYDGRIGWVIAGGESGLGARPMHPDWVRGLRDACDTYAVPFFFKQWGEWKAVTTAEEGISAASQGLSCCQAPGSPLVLWRFGKKAAGKTLDGREHLAVPAWQFHSQAGLV